MLRGPHPQIALAVSTLAVTLALSTGAALGNELHVALVLLACTAFGAAVVSLRRGSHLGIRPVVLAVVVQSVAAISVAPQATGDLWWYAAYGRMLAVYHASPYTHVAADFPHDPVIAMAGRAWRHTPSVYGPLFTAVSAVQGALLSTDPLTTRLFYQGLALIALLVACIVIWRHTHSAHAIALVALNPLVPIYLVNGGRNDLLLGLALLGAAVFARRRSFVAAGCVAAAGALVKLTGVVGIVALVVAIFRRDGRSAATRVAAAAGATLAIGTLVAGPSALLTPFGTAGAIYSRASVWKLFGMAPIGTPPSLMALGVAGLVVTLVVVRTGRRGEPENAVAATETALTLSAPYTLPGYVAWALPSAALEPSGRIALITSAQGLVLVAAYEVARHPIPGPIVDTLHAVTTVGAPLALLGLLGALLLPRRRALADSRTAAVDSDAGAAVPEASA